MPQALPRLIDLHVDWPLQYAAETTLFEPTFYADLPDRLPQIEGYLGATSAAVVALFRRADDWARQSDPWRALGTLVTRVEAEFSGRLLLTSDDLARWRQEPDSLTWAVVGVEGFDALVREPADLDRLPALFERGVRLFQPVSGPSSRLGGSSAQGDDRGLTDLGRDFLRVLAELGTRPNGPRPILDLAHMNPLAMADVLDWFEADSDRSRRLVPVASHGSPAHEAFDSPRAISRQNLARLRAIGGGIGFGVTPRFFDTPARLRDAIRSAAEVPFLGRAGFEGLAIGTDFLGVASTLPGLEDAEAVVSWLARSFDAETATALIRGNAQTLIERASGADVSVRPVESPDRTH